ncbi:MAG TPA: BamA/TamA family outer membrane protein, partial [Candidatus Babeliales bacterium]|nr:BamA/TamA family outer membrane protein [Candidatus Babeliales bacterium]
KGNTQDGVRIFSILEGPQTFIKQVLINDAKQFSSSKLINKFFKLIVGHLYDHERIKKAIEDLTNFYIRAGFWDFNITKHEYMLVDISKPNYYNLLITISEGPQRFLRSVSIPGHEELIMQWPFLKGKKAKKVPFDLGLIKEQKQWLMEHFYKTGYPFKSIEPKLDEDGNEVDLSWLVTALNNHVTFGKTIINLTGRLPYDKVQREICYLPGEPWDHKKVERTLKRLRNLDIFETVSCRPEVFAYDQDKRDLMLSLVEADPLSMRARFGFEKINKSLTIYEGSTYKIGGSILWRNPTNNADQFRFDADVTRFDRTIQGLYQIPWVFDWPISMTVKAYSNKYYQPLVIDSDIPLYSATNDGFLVQMAYKAVQGFIGNNVGLHFTGLHETPLTEHKLGNVLDIDNQLLNTKLAYIIYEPYLAFDTTDNLLNPTTGFSTNGSCKLFISPNNNSSFGKFVWDSSLFASLGPVVTAVHFVIGHIFNAQFHEIIPSERFYLGGSRTLRAYEPNSAPPLSCLELPPQHESDRPINQLVPQGGKSMLNGNLEVRFPIFKSLSGAVFQDVGVLAREFGKLLDNELLSSTGFGLRLNTQVGLLRFDIAWKWKLRHVDDSPYAIYLTVGHAF